MNKSNHTELLDKEIIENWLGMGIADIDTSKTYNLTGTHLKEILTALTKSALIVHRVNNWDKLVEALEYIEFGTHIVPEVYQGVDTNEREKALVKAALGGLQIAAKDALKLAKEGI